MIHQTKTNAMNGVSTHTHDPISRGEFTEVVALRNCELCNDNFWEDSLNPFQDYDRVCETCIALTEQEDKENESYNNGAFRRTMDILEILKEDRFSEARRLIIEGINK